MNLFSVLRRSHLDATHHCFPNVSPPGHWSGDLAAAALTPLLLHPHLRCPPLLRVNAQFPQGWIHQSCPRAHLLSRHPSRPRLLTHFHAAPQSSAEAGGRGPGLRPPITACQTASPNGGRCQSAQWLKLKPQETSAPLLFCLFVCPSLLALSGCWHWARSRDGCPGPNRK